MQCLQTLGMMGGVSDRLCSPSQLKPSNHLCFCTAWSLSIPYPSRSDGLSLYRQPTSKSAVTHYIAHRPIRSFLLNIVLHCIRLSREVLQYRWSVRKVSTCNIQLKYKRWFQIFKYSSSLYLEQLKMIWLVILFVVFLPARRYASAGYSDRNVSVCLSVCLSVCPCVRPSRAGIVSKRRKLAAWFLHHVIAPRL